ncbi:unnamed protein product [Kuraishia capsulata CBS 1993]|uniref:Altered inheritance of mitochondria protein 6 n=1 Tax=Kuraishia capsulata CBS 1993 TaxID=1382522 RepID=W6MRL0_9ASCO|nr:uncharacterized protein KUCA_T00005384001 [Kuraishia capsulata CBS 1993]CDK29396.1 unnamed protein product [Kuraishia capsulata CBS 1993]
MFNTKRSTVPTSEEDAEMLELGFRTDEQLKNLKNSNRTLKIAVSVLGLLVTVLCAEFAAVIHRFSVVEYLTEHVLIKQPTEYNVEVLTRNVQVVPVHSHNDEMRYVPFFDAYTKGCNSIEADTWYLPEHPDTLLVGHNKGYLRKDNTLDNLYLDHLWHSLIDANSESEDDKINGIFYNSPEATTYFYIDVKSDGIKTLELLEEKLKEFLDRDFLTTFNQTSGEFIEGPLTVVITGAYPYDYIVSKDFRYMFIDAPLNLLEDEADLYPARNVSIFASCSLEQITGLKNKPWNYVHGITEDDLEKVSSTLARAHEIGLQTRIWDTPAWPLYVRNGVWRQLIESGADYLNVDDLKAATGELW